MKALGNFFLIFLSARSASKRVVKLPAQILKFGVSYSIDGFHSENDWLKSAFAF